MSDEAGKPPRPIGPDIHPGARWFFSGIGGVGMNPLAHLFARRGMQVVGSDCAAQKTLDPLRAAGITCYVGHDAAHVEDADLFVYSTAIAQDNPEFVRARERGIPCLHRSLALALLVNNSHGVTIAGTHGKTTTAAMTAILFAAAGLDPTAVIGGFVPQFNAYFRDGHGPHVIAESDESDGSFDRLVSSIALMLNIDADHLDFYPNIEAIETAFCRFLANVRPDGTVIYNADDPRVCHAVASAPAAAARVSCALDARADFTASGIRLLPWSSEFTVHGGGSEFPVTLGTPGRHNVLNALHAIAAARVAGVSIESILASLPSFHGVHRRFQLIGEFNGAAVIDDYAHHPCEIAATHAAARGLGRPILAVFQPHRFSRTRKLLDEFTDVLGSFDRLILTDIFAASEHPSDVSGQTLFDRVRSRTPGTQYIPRVEDLLPAVAAAVRPGDVVLFIGAGSISAAAHALVAMNRAHSPSPATP